MIQQSGNQFEDDLTIAFEDDDSFSTESIDLFEFAGGEDSPIARLKTIILSIDWEINDDILQQLDDELVDLSDIWATDKIKLVFIQGLRKIGKYIYREKANAHPNAIQLLITFYHNLEKIVSAADVMSEDEKKEILLENVKKFDQLKSQIGKHSADSNAGGAAAPAFSSEPQNESDDVAELETLKALILGLDWEINGRELEQLGEEVGRLEGAFRKSKAKLILLQGIGALCSYINKMRSKSNSKAFTLLHSFYEVLEKMPSGDLPLGENKELLLAEVAKFKSFKTEIAADELNTESVETEETVVEARPDVVTEVSNEVLPVQDDDASEVEADIESRLFSVFGDVEDDVDHTKTDKSIVLEGVNVETEADDDSDEEVLPFADGVVAPALSGVNEESSFSVEKLASDLAKSIVPEGQDVDNNIVDSVVPGVDVETEADDDSDQEALPFIDGDVAPALMDSGDEGGFDEATLTAEIDKSESEDLDNRLDSLFDDDVQDLSQEPDSVQEEGTVVEEAVQPIAALSDVDAGESEDLDNRLDSLFDDDVQDLSQEPDSVQEEGTVVEEAVQPIAALSDIAGEEKSDFSDGIFTSVSGEDEDILTAIDSIEATLEEKDDDEISNKKAESSLSFLDDDCLSSASLETEKIFEAEPDSGEAMSAFFNDSAPAPALSESADCSFEESLETPPQEGIEAAEVVFEVAEDDAEVDLLPGEEYVDNEDEAVERFVVDQIHPDFVTGTIGESVFVDYASLGASIQLMQGDVNDTNLQALFAEINRTRSQSASSIIGKIFLQLLSTAGQHIERNMDTSDSTSLPLMDDIFSGLLMSASPDVPSEQVQLHLLNCTSQVLLLQQKDIVTESGKIATDETV
ncbi:MAG: hypothetical protein JKY62_09865 [Desulfocapsa sp.]|nr:hypothetical protein [Desulfocapsa sp.]